MKTAPNEEPTGSAPELAARALDKELNGAGASAPLASSSAQVNDLTSIVKKKKKAPDVNGQTSMTNGTGSAKRKADEELVEGDKKLKLES